MHMADALVSPVVAGTMYACTAVAAGYSIKKLHLESDPKKIPVIGVMGAFVFAAQMINFTIPGTGASGHLCGGMLLAAVLGPYAGFLTLLGVLVIQCLMFADGGILALGANVWNMAFYGCFIGGLVIWKLMMRHQITKKRIIVASILGSVLTLQLGAFSVTLQTLASGITELPFPIFVASMQPIHLLIGLVEGLIIAAVLCFLYEARPELLWTGEEKTEQTEKGRLSYKSTVISLGAAALVIGGLVSLTASANPDGLEWSMEKVAGTAELASEGTAHEMAEGVQGITALLPDYGMPGIGGISGTVISGVLGVIVVAGLCTLVGLLLRNMKKKTDNNEKN